MQFRRWTSGTTCFGVCTIWSPFFLATVTWATSSYSTGEANCVQVALGGSAIGVRDSQDPDGPVLAVPAGRWLAFLLGVADGDFDR